jgi:hypothetical protein
MESHEPNSAQEILRKENLKAQDVKSLSKEQDRIKAYAAREQKIENGQKIKENKRADDLAKEAIRELAKEKARKEAYQAQEAQIAQAQAARKAKQ